MVQQASTEPSGLRVGIDEPVPALLRVPGDGAAIEVELWELPAAGLPGFRDAEGVVIDHYEDKMGLRGTNTSNLKLAGTSWTLPTASGKGGRIASTALCESGESSLSRATAPGPARYDARGDGGRAAVEPWIVSEGPTLRPGRA